jgi:putative toxin-antitoxin system antitoxin component (TIGR02293 family)
MRLAADVLPLVLPTTESDGSLVESVSDLLGLASPLQSELDVIDRIEQGLSVGAVRALRERIGLTDAETYALIAPRRTLQRRETLRQPLSRDEADRTLRIARIAARARRVFSANPAYATEWLRGTQTGLGGRTPLQALATEAGALAVDEILIGIEHGMFG